MDGLGDRARNDYLFARTVIGRDFLAPRWCAAAPIESGEEGPSSGLQWLSLSRCNH
jgi:hypothetical protein